LDWLTFLATSIKSLVWPTFGLIGLFVFKRQIANLLSALGSRLVTAKAVDFEFTFSERVTHLEDSLLALPAPETKQIAAGEETEHVELSKFPPPYIISQAWLRLEGAMDKIVREENIIGLFGSPASMIPSHLRKLGILENYELSVLVGLQELRNHARYSADPKITLTDALRYADLVTHLIRIIDERRKEQKPAIP
jgi:hypothetical protein